MRRIFWGRQLENFTSRDRLDRNRLRGGYDRPFKSHVTAEETPLYGYSAESSHTERQWEEKFRAIPSPDNLRMYMKRLSARPHNVGSPYDKDNAEWIASKFREFGLDTHIETFNVLFPTPKERLVELVEGGPHFTAKLQEPTVDGDPTSGQTDEQLPTYNAYSIDGDVTGSPGVRQLRIARRLRSSRAAWNFGERRDHHCAVRTFVARDQTPGGRRTRRDRMHYLFRSAGRRLCGWRSVSEGAVPAKGRSAAGQRAGQHRIHGRSADAGNWRDCRTQKDCRSRTRNR